jgi:hypothetical protein
VEALMVDDEKKPEKIEALNQYLRDQFPDQKVRHHPRPDLMAEVFTIIRGPSTNFLRLVISDEYIDDHSEAQLVEAMNNHDIGQKLEGCAGKNLYLGNRGLDVVARE